VNEIREIQIPVTKNAYSLIHLHKHDEHECLSEFIDNSLQSFTKHKTDRFLASIGKFQRDTLIYKEKQRVNVTITVNREEDYLIIEDDAWGIYPDEITRALVLGIAPPDLGNDTPKLSRWGMGMKIAAFWYANNWSIETANHNEETKRIYSFSLKDIEECSSDIPTIKEIKIPNPKDLNGNRWHGTKIKLEKPNQKKLFTARSKWPVIECLKDIYQYYISGGWEQNRILQGPSLNLYLREITLSKGEREEITELLEYEQHNVKHAPVLVQYLDEEKKIKRKRTTVNYLWKKQIDLTFGAESYRAKGFFICTPRKESGNLARKPGLRILQAGRVIMGPRGSHLPNIIYPGSRTNTRTALFLLGHIHIDERLKVSPDKNVFFWPSYAEEKKEIYRGQIIKYSNYQDELYWKIKVILKEHGASDEREEAGEKIFKDDVLNKDFPFDLLYQIDNIAVLDELPSNAPGDITGAGEEASNAGPGEMDKPADSEGQEIRPEGRPMAEEVFTIQGDEKNKYKRLKISVVEYPNLEKTLFQLRSSEKEFVHIEIQLSHVFFHRFTSKSVRQAIGRMACAAVYAQYYIDTYHSDDDAVKKITSSFMNKYNQLLFDVFSGEEDVPLGDAMDDNFDDQDIDDGEG
jgi:hypothetical protein